MTAPTATTLFKTLSDAGFKKSHVRALLPSWWDDQHAASDAGAWELALLLARRLSLDVTDLAHGVVRPTGAVNSVAFKHRKSQDPAELTPSSLIAGSIAQAVLASMPAAQPGRRTASDIRQAILAQHRTVGFDELLAYCWSCGIPVIPLLNLPVGMRKMDGAIFSVEDRPVIVLSRKQESRAWMSFILAHELAHFCCGHLKSNAAIVDVELQNNATYQAESAQDPQEREADEFALDLLGGAQAEAIASSWSAQSSPVGLAVAAREQSQGSGVAAGHLVLRFAFLTKRWPVALSALAYLKEDFDAQRALLERLNSAIDISQLAEDLRDHLKNIVGIAD